MHLCDVIASGLFVKFVKLFSNNLIKKNNNNLNKIKKYFVDLMHKRIKTVGANSEAFLPYNFYSIFGTK